jgi:hypothetical protein
LCRYDADKAIMDVKAHTSIVNAIDGCGGQAKGYGAPELVTSGRDGAVRVWDVRQRQGRALFTTLFCCTQNTVQLMTASC